MCPGPQSVAVIKYLESLAKTIDISQTSQPCSSRAPVAIYSEHGEPEAKTRPLSSGDDGGGTLWKYFVKK